MLGAGWRASSALASLARVDVHRGGYSRQGLGDPFLDLTASSPGPPYSRSFVASRRPCGAGAGEGVDGRRAH